MYVVYLKNKKHTFCTFDEKQFFSIIKTPKQFKIMSFIVYLISINAINIV